jgi:steroid delta-isomerase
MVMERSSRQARNPAWLNAVMPADPNHIKSVINNYIEALGQTDADRIAALYTDDATVEDPVGTPPHVGNAAVRDFYAGMAKMADSYECALATPINVAGNEVVFGFKIHAKVGDATMEIVPIDHMIFNDTGQITAMRAFWNPADIKQV